MKAVLAFIVFISISIEIFAGQNLRNLKCIKDGKISSFQLNSVAKSAIETKPDLINDSDNNYDFKGIVEIGYALKATTYGYDFLKLNAIYGCKINPNFYLGLGTGLRLYLDNHAIFNSFAAYPEIPVFTDIRMNFNNKKITPYIALDIGYTFQADDNFKGLGFLINPAVGLSFKTLAKTTMNVGLGYEMQQVKDYRLDGLSKGVSYGALSLNMGITF